VIDIQGRKYTVGPCVEHGIEHCSLCVSNPPSKWTAVLQPPKRIVLKEDNAKAMYICDCMNEVHMPFHVHESMQKIGLRVVCSGCFRKMEFVGKLSEVEG